MKKSTIQNQDSETTQLIKSIEIAFEVTKGKATQEEIVELAEMMSNNLLIYKIIERTFSFKGGDDKITYGLPLRRGESIASYLTQLNHKYFTKQIIGF
jgi:hypothetical protein